MVQPRAVTQVPLPLVAGQEGDASVKTGDMELPGHVIRSIWLEIEAQSVIYAAAHRQGIRADRTSPEQVHSQGCSPTTSPTPDHG